MNQDSYNSNSLGFDQPQPPQSPVIYQPPQELSIQEMEDLKQQYLDELKRLSNLEYRVEITIAKLKENFNGMSIKIRKKEKLMQLEQWAYLSTHPSKRLNSFCYDDDDDEDYNIAVTPSLSIEEPDNSLSMGDEHLDTIPATESDEFIKSSVENLILIPSESEIFLPFLVYSVAPPYLLSLRHEDIIFDPSICNSYFFKPDVSHRCGTVMKFNTHRSHLNECPMLINEKNTPILEVPLFHFYPP
nr:hypothetical protein [Tanacetum cinerariifolium]